MARSWTEDLRWGLKWGIVWAVVLGTIASLVVAVGKAIGADPLAELTTEVQQLGGLRRISWGWMLGFYLLGGVTAGMCVGLLRPIATASWLGSALVGSVATVLVFALTSISWFGSWWLRPHAAVILGAWAMVGAFYGLAFRYGWKRHRGLVREDREANGNSSERSGQE